MPCCQLTQRSHPRLALALACALAYAAPNAQAGEVYAGIGLPGVMLGFAQPLNERVTLRGDVASLGERNKQRTEEGIRYEGTAKLARSGLFADWFVAGGSFRLTGGMTFNDASLRLLANGNGEPIDIGGTLYPTTPEDQMKVLVKYPSSMPYLGIGWGHQSGAPGLGFVFDLGVAIGTPKVTATTTGPNLGAVDPDDLNRELEELRDGVAKVKVLPQLSLGLSYRF